ncbi:MAG TPA: MOSC N-terminal beta barrel domain-containing protein [Solirubrobacteraceae bacterium]|nr:MOSC N-terminal beta barrel domain-containing protein [Solirubrobacteraceae bacterium]
MSISVSTLSVTPIKGTRLRTVEAIELGPLGAAGDRRFYVIDERGRMVNGKVVVDLQTVVADWSEDTGELALAFPNGTRVAGIVDGGPEVATTFFSQPRDAIVPDGPWSQALSDHFGRPLRLVRTDSAVDRGHDGGVSLVSSASVARFAEVADRDQVDARRFRMLIEIDGVDAHAEDGWVGRRVRVGESELAFHGHVGRCAITTRDPDTAERDIPTLDLLRAYRADLDTTEPLPFGIYGEVLRGGRIAIGDPVQPL